MQETPPSQMRQANTALLHVAVDFTEWVQDNEHQEARRFALGYLKSLASYDAADLRLVFLTSIASHAEASALARRVDEVLCVETAFENNPESDGRPGQKTWLSNPPPDFLLRIGVHALYAPLGYSKYACAEIPSVNLITDVLHRDYPGSLVPESIARCEQGFIAAIGSQGNFHCVSEFTKSRVKANYTIEGSRLACIYPSIEIRPYDQPDRRDPASMRPYFLYPADARPHKNHPTLLVSYRVYLHQAGERGWDLMLLGREDEPMQRLRQLANTLGVGKKVHFAGNGNTPEQATPWKLASAVVFPSLYEGFAHPLLEAMDFNCPILSGEGSSLFEVAGTAALYSDQSDPFKFAKAMLQMATDPELRKKLVELGKKRRSDLAVEKQGSKLATFVRTCAQRAAPFKSKGIHLDSWIERHAIIALPEVSEIRQIKISLFALPVSRRLVVSLGLTECGTFELPPGQVHEIKLDLNLDGAPLVLDVPDAANLNPADDRIHGIALDSITVADSAGNESKLDLPNS